VTRIAPPEALRARFLATLPAAVNEAIRSVIEAAGGSPVYAVGGAVRDLLLGTAAVDIDLAVEGDAVDLTRRAFPSASITAHARFGTASVVVAGTRIDLASTRSETYTRPGALPKVAPGSIDDDLRRRDFSMNAMAIRLTGTAVLADPCGGADDIAARLVRVLHDGSFADDATRMFRALRYAARLGFSLEAHTAALLRDGTGHVAAVGGERLRREIELILAEPAAGTALEACQATGALRAIHPALQWDTTNTRELELDRNAPRVLYGFALLAARAPADDADAICERLRLKRDEAAAVRGIAAMRGVEKMLRRPHAKPSGVVVLLDRFPAAAVAAFAATAPDAIARHMAARYLDQWRHVKPMLSGRDLQEMGVRAGPQVQKGLQLIRAARLDGWATDRRDEQALILRFAKSIRDSGAAASGLEIHLNGN
jgi:tRNA nucleotidyltransferase (CCA-adding enzyme)